MGSGKTVSRILLILFLLGVVFVVGVYFASNNVRQLIGELDSSLHIGAPTDNQYAEVVFGSFVYLLTVMSIFIYVNLTRFVKKLSDA